MKLITEMFEGVEGIDEAIIKKAETLVEATINEQVDQRVQEAVQAEVARLDEQYETAKQTFITESEDKLSAFVDSVVLEWAKDNAVQVDNQIKVQIAEQFLTQLKEAFVKAEVQLPEADVQVVESLQTQLTEVTNQKSAVEAQLQEAQKALVEKTRQEIIAEATKDLVETQAERVVRLTEGFEFKDAESFKEKVAIIVEALTDKEKPASKKDESDDKVVDDEGEGEDEDKKIDESAESLQKQALKFITGR